MPNGILGSVTAFLIKDEEVIIKNIIVEIQCVSRRFITLKKVLLLLAVPFTYSQEFLPFDVFAPFVLFTIVRFSSISKPSSKKPTFQTVLAGAFPFIYA